MVPTLPPQGVFGREETLVEIEAMLAGGTSGTPDLSPVALRGFGGIGKTTLAAAIGSRRNVAELYPDGVFWVEIGLKPSIRQLLTTWGDALGIDLRAEWDEDACKARLRNVISRRRALLIIDDVWDANHARYFLVGGPRCRTLFTTREWEVATALTTSDRVCNVGLLTQDASLQMLTRLAPEAVAADPQVAQKLCAKLDGLPLGIKLAGQLLALEGGVPSRARKLLEELVARREARLRLLEREGRLGLPGVEPPSLQAIMGMSVERLDQTDRARFAMLAVFGGEPLTWEIGATAAVWVCSVDEAEATTSQLIQHGLVERRQDDRYWMHALLADYAQELLEKTYPAARRVMP